MANRNVARAVRLALVAAGAAAAGMQGTAVYAQDTELEEVVVTGSRIRIAADSETTQPVAVISRQDIEQQGFQSVADILQNTTVAGTPPLSRSSPLSAGEAAGGSFISLRNLGAARTLILMNGKRLPVTTSGLADVSLIPSIAVERVEVLKDGASSIYGSDAIAGVVNIITRSNFDGMNVGAYFGQYEDGDGETTRAEFIAGYRAEKGSIAVAAEWASEDEVWSRDRPYSAYPRSSFHPTDGWTIAGEVGGFVTSASNPVAGIPNGTRMVLSDGGDFRDIADYRRQNTNTGSCQPAAGANTTDGCVPGSTLDKSNTNYWTHLRTPLERRSINVDFTYDLADWVRLRSNLLYSNRNSDRVVAGYPYQSSTFPAPIAANSYFNPLGVPITNWWRRSWEVPRESGSDVTTYNVVATLEGDFQMFDRRFDWDAGYQRAESDQLQSTYGNLNVTRVQQAVGPSFLNSQGQVQCGTPSAPIAISSCVPWNPFLAAGVTGPGSMTGNQALIDYIFQEEHARGSTMTEVWSANLTGAAFTLPAGDLSFAVGYEHREEQGEFVPDALAVTGTSTNLSSGPTEGEYSLDEFYLELQVPIVKDVFLLNELSLNAAIRYSDYDTFGDTTNSKVGLKWKPLDQLMLRGTWSEGFRAPTIANLYGGGSQTFAFFTDPCDTNFGSSATNPNTRANCVAAMGALANTFRQLAQGFIPATAPNAQTPVPFISGSNPTLQPETSETKTAGFVWSPPWVQNLNIAADWWNVRIEDTIVADSPTLILDDCYVQGLASRCSQLLFTRDAAQGYVNFMQYGSRNAGYREVAGYDLELTYSISTDWGVFSVGSTTTYTYDDTLVSTNDPRVGISNVGSASSTIGSIWRTRSNLNLGWTYQDYGVSWNIRYYSGLDEPCTYFVAGTTEPNLECSSMEQKPTGLFGANGEVLTQLTRENQVGSVAFNDVQARWTAPWDGTLSVGVNNAFDKVGPVMYSQPNANVSYNGAYDIGRFFYVKYNQRF
jgi:iron complex outermembrane receptor protein